REARAGKLLLREIVEEVRLVARAVAGPEKTRRARGRVGSDAGVVPGRDGLAAEGRGPLEKALELHLGIADRARDRRLPLEIVRDEGLHDRLGEALLEVQNEVRHADHAGRPARDRKI